MTILHRKLSPTARALIRTKIGHRNESLSSGIYKIQDVIEFETSELGNTDILRTCEKLYGESPLKVIQDRFQTLDVYGTWFTSVTGIIQHYREDVGVTHISNYYIPKNALILSDLDTEGVLFAHKEHPSQIITGRTALTWQK